MDSCHALNHCRIKEQPRKLLAMVEGLEMVQMAGSDECCGFGGTFAVNMEAISVQMAEQKIQNILDTGAEIIISTDYACLMHLDSFIKKQNIPLRIMHLADVLASGL